MMEEDLEATLNPDNGENTPCIVRFCSSLPENCWTKKTKLPLTVGFFSTLSAAGMGFGSALLAKTSSQDYQPLEAMGSNFVSALITSLPLVLLMGKGLEKCHCSPPENNAGRVNRIMLLNSIITVVSSPLAYGLYYLGEEWVLENQNIEMGPLEFVLAATLGSSIINAGLFATKKAIDCFVQQTEGLPFRQ